MKTITIDNTKFNIPESWDDITIQKQINVERFNKEHPDLGIINILAGYLELTTDQVKKLHLNSISSLIKELSFINTPLNVLEPVHEFEHGGYKYLLVPSLLASEFQDYISLESIREQYKDNLYESLPKIIAVLAKREGETLDSYDIEERSKLFYDLPITIANGLYSFFLFSANLLNQDYNQLAVQENQRLQELINSILNTLNKPDGSGLSTRLQKGMLRKFVLSIAKQWNKYYSGYNLEQEKQN